MVALTQSFPSALLPQAPGLQFRHAAIDGQVLTVQLEATAPVGSCPRCQQPSTHVHSRYTRTAADLPWAGYTLQLMLRVRKFFCRHPACAQQIFAERLPAVLAPHARVTVRLHTVLRLLAFALGGEAGARVCARLGIATSPDRLLTVIRRTPPPAAPTPPWVGVDDWAKHKGCTYGSILVDLETHRVVDLLPDRDAATLAVWLQRHPGVRVVARDRFEPYAAGIRQGAPDALQVVDRWHVLKNVGDALEQVGARHQDAVRAVAQALLTASTTGSPPSTPTSSQPPPPHGAAADATPCQHQSPHHDRRRGQHARVHELRAQGLTISAISRELGLSRPTVRKYLRAAGYLARSTRYRHLAALSVHEAYVRHRWAAGCQNAAALWRELCAQGFTGSAGTVRRYVGRWRTTPRGPGRQPRSRADPRPPPPRPPSARRVRWWLLCEGDQLTADETAFVQHLRATCPAVAHAADLARAFHDLVRTRDAAAFGAWLARADHSGLAEFAAVGASLRQDRSVVEAALTLPWSTGPVEGHVNRLKLIKRSMYGRANFDLLRQRVLNHG